MYRETYVCMPLSLSLYIYIYREIDRYIYIYIERERDISISKDTTNRRRASNEGMITFGASGPINVIQKDMYMYY